MQAKGIINENYKPSITLSPDSSDFSIIQDNDCITHVDCDIISATTKLSFKFCYQFIVYPELDSLEAKLCDKIMAVKSFWMNFKP